MTPTVTQLGARLVERTRRVLGRRPRGPTEICHLVDTLEVGGVANVVAALLGELPRQGFRTRCLCLGARGQLTPELPEGAEVAALEQRPASLHRSVVALARELRQRPVHILHTHGWSAFAPGLLAAQLARVPILLHSESGALFHDGTATSQLLRVSSWLTARVITSTNYMATLLADRLDIDRGRITTLPAGIDCDRFRPDDERRRTARAALGIGPGAIVIGSTGRLHREKNYPMLLEAVASLAAEEPARELRCLLVGDGYEEDALRARARALGIGSKLHITGFTRNVAGMLAAMDLFVLPSLAEGVPHTLLEAMASGLPVVATTVGGIRELVRDGDTGLLVPSERPTILARVLGQLVANEPRRRALGERARRYVERHHSVGGMIAEHLALYRDLAS
jgi:glycosyltransferase involved in cell wall biosynthesis